MIDLARISAGLHRGPEGIWAADADPSGARVSFPAEGHAECLQVEDDSFWFRHRNACLLELLRRYPPSGTILELGAGNGFVSRAFEEAGYPCVALEPAPEGARNAKHRGVDLVVCATLEAAKFSAGVASLPLGCSTSSSTSSTMSRSFAKSFAASRPAAGFTPRSRPMVGCGQTKTTSPVTSAVMASVSSKTISNGPASLSSTPPTSFRLSWCPCSCSARCRTDSRGGRGRPPARRRSTPDPRDFSPARSPKPWTPSSGGYARGVRCPSAAAVSSSRGSRPDLRPLTSGVAARRRA